ncbi:MAG: hypothetical protein NTX61_02945 [Bacteroidetes bacterium]|nr:hypothetical protein [Bacteroidota bacterium]
MNTDENKLVDKLTTLIKEKNQSFQSDKTFAEFEEYHEEMRNLGISKKQDYNISPIDTIGRRFYYDMQHVNNNPSW